MEPNFLQCISEHVWQSAMHNVPNPLVVPVQPDFSDDNVYVSDNGHLIFNSIAIMYADEGSVVSAFRRQEMYSHDLEVGQT